jgi:hypothetical protein
LQSGAWQAAGDTYAHSYYGHAQPAPEPAKPSAAAGMLCYPGLAEPATAWRGSAR